MVKVLTFEEKIKTLIDKTIGNNVWRKTETFNLIPSENETSPLVKLLEISDPSGRYAEHRTEKGVEVYYYQATKPFIKPIEEELISELKYFLDVPLVEPRPISGAMANSVLYQGIVSHLGRKINLVLANGLIAGGHLTHRSSGALFQCVEVGQDGKERLITIPTDANNPYKANQSKLDEIIINKRPELIIFGKSMYLFREPIEHVRQLIDSNHLHTIIMEDDAHPLALFNSLPNSHYLTASTHKTFFGTQRGLVASGLSESHPLYTIWTHIKNRAFPGNTSNHHLGTLLGLLMATYEMNEFKELYKQQIISNAKAFARSLKAEGVNVEGEIDGFTETHQVIINVRPYGNGIDIAERLEKNNIITNYQALPYDRTFNNPSGIRIGVQEMTRYGMKEPDFEQLALYMADSIKGNDVKNVVSKFRKNFLQMQYTIEPEKGAILAAKLLNSIVPDMEYIKIFVDNLIQLVNKK